MSANVKKWFAASEEKTFEIEDGSPKRCLLLDDDADFTEIVAEYLQTQGYQVTIVKNGAEGLKKIMAEDYDALICDMVMPGLPGDMFYLAVEKVKPRLCKRFVFVTGHRGDPKIDAFIRRVGGFMLWKPFEMQDLVTAIRTVMRKAEAAEAAAQSGNPWANRARAVS